MAFEDEIERIKKADVDNEYYKKEYTRLKESYTYLERENARLLKNLEDAREEFEIEREGFRKQARRATREAEQRREEIALLKNIDEIRIEKIEKLNTRLKEETGRLKEETARREELEQETGDLREKLTAEEAARKRSLSWKVKKLIAG